MNSSKVFVLVLSAGSALLVQTELLQASELEGLFFEGSAGAATLNKQGLYDDTAASYGLNGGYRWNMAPSIGLGIETGFARVGHFHGESGLAVPASIQGWNVGANFRANLSPNWYVSARGGFFRGQETGAYYANDDAASLYSSSRSNDYYVGAGFGYNVNERLGVGLVYNYYEGNRHEADLNASAVSAEIEVRF